MTDHKTPMKNPHNGAELSRTTLTRIAPLVAEQASRSTVAYSFKHHSDGTVDVVGWFEDAERGKAWKAEYDPKASPSEAHTKHEPEHDPAPEPEAKTEPKSD